MQKNYNKEMELVKQNNSEQNKIIQQMKQQKRKSKEEIDDKDNEIKRLKNKINNLNEQMTQEQKKTNIASKLIEKINYEKKIQNNKMIIMDK